MRESASRRKTNFTYEAATVDKYICIKDGMSHLAPASRVRDDHLVVCGLVFLEEGESLEVIETVYESGSVDRYHCKVPNSDWQKVIVYAENVKENA